MNESLRAHLPSYALFAGVLAAAGLPIYIHAPKFYVDEFGVSLAALGTVLFGLRLLDVVQDPLLARLAEFTRAYRQAAVGIAAALMALAMVCLLGVSPAFPALWWFAMWMAVLFSAFSFLAICFYAQGVAKAATLPGNGHLTLARWRETGALIGVCLAAVAPVVVGQWLDQPFAGFALGFAVLSLMAFLTMRGEWQTADMPHAIGFGPVLRDPVARRLLLIALVNAAPVVVSSTLFLFFVESRLQAPGGEGVLLLLFFLSAALAAPVWGLLAERHGARPVLMFAMALSIVAFGFALTLGAGDTALFALICIGSGAALGADLTLLPAMFARRMATIAPSAAEGFGLWNFVSKFTLAFAAVILFPILDASGFSAGTNNPQTALTTLGVLYAAVPCGLKVLAISLLAGFDPKENAL